MHVTHAVLSHSDQSDSDVTDDHVGVLGGRQY